MSTTRDRKTGGAAGAFTERRPSRPGTGPALRIVAGLVLALGGAADGVHADPGEPFVLATPAPRSIDCSETPFGLSAQLSRNTEPFYFTRGSAGQTVDEFRSATPWESEPLLGVYRANLIQGSVPNRSWRSAIAADLNGDGRDELVAAFSDGADVQVVVYARTAGLQPTATVLDRWSFGEGLDADSLQLQAGDFDGSADGKQELAVSWQVSGATRVVFLTGAADGGIVEANGTPAGNWTAPGASGLRPRLAAGDFLLDGRDQVVLVGADNPSHPTVAQLTIDLIEFATPWPASVLERRPGSTGGIGSRRFTNALPGLALESSPWGGSNVGWDAATALDADAGDLTDSAAGELVVHIQFRVESLTGPLQGYSLAQRLFHFDTARAADNALTGIALGNGGSHDASRIVTNYTPLTTVGSTRPPPAFDAVVADIDGLPPLEIVTLEAGREPGGNGLNDSGPLRWWAHHAYVRLAAGFEYQNLGPSPTNPNLRTVRFRSTAHGEIVQYHWDLGGGITSPDRDPLASFPAGDRTVALTVTERGGATTTHAMTVHVGGSDGAHQPAWTYGIVGAPIYRGRDASASFASTSLARLAVGDIDNDGQPEVLSFARDSGNALHRQAWDLDDVAQGTYAMRQVTESAAGLDAIGLVASDFDGNSIRATLGIDCRQVTDRSTRTVTWLPPYFEALQSPIYMQATFGQSTSGSSAYENRSGSYFSHDISGYLGVNHEIAVFGLTVAEWSVKATAGHNWQSAKGRFSGSESEYSINDGASQYGNAALVEVETNQSKCYSYDVERSTGPVPGSGLRMCEVLPSGTERQATDAVNWNSLANEVRPVRVPLHWVPLQRDWASVSLFRPVTASNVITFPAGKEADKATDGLFSTAAESAQATTRPYLQIDLGEVRDIGAIRVFPTEGRAKQLAGYRLYASETPFVGSGVPAGAGVREIRQNTGDTETSYSTWNLWTRDEMDPSVLMRARYLRLQHPSSQPVELHVAEIQVFGETHAEPPSYPDAVCDPKVGDGHFLGKVWDPVNRVYRNIELRGDLIWSGVDDNPVLGVSPPAYDTTVTLADGRACYNGIDNVTPGFPVYSRRATQYSIWKDRSIGTSGSAFWGLDTSTLQTSGNYTSMDSATRIGAEFEAQLGVGTSAVLGAAYEFTFGATQDYQSSVSWGSGLSIGGEVGGFENPAPGVVDQCRYFPRPYAFNLREYSNVGFAQDMYVTDYVVKHLPRGASVWQRGAVPVTCFGGTLSDLIFKNGFDG